MTLQHTKTEREAVKTVISTKLMAYGLSTVSETAQENCINALADYVLQQVAEGQIAAKIEANKWWINQAAHVSNVFKTPIDRKEVTLEAIQIAAKANIDELKRLAPSKEGEE